PTAIPQTLRLHRGCPGILPPLLHLVQPGSPSRRHRIDDPGPSALRPGQGCPCRPPGRPGAGIPSKPGTLRTQNPRAAAYAYPDLDQPTPENRNQPSLNRDVGCLKVIDTFRGLTRTRLAPVGSRQLRLAHRVVTPFTPPRGLGVQPSSAWFTLAAGNS